jgi:uncharacterized protein YutE (UPF0331/DUF86 family)
LVDVNIVHARIERIRKRVSKLKKITRTQAKTEFLRDSDAIDVAEHNIQMAIQCVLDVSNHILADQKAGVPDDHRKIFTMLASQKILSNDLADRLGQMAGLRNVLVHEYLDVDLEILYRAMTEELSDFEKFIRAVTKLI